MREFDIHQNKTVALKYLVPGEIDTYLTLFGDRVACVVGFGSGRCMTLKSGFPVLWVDTPVSGGDAVYEVWISDKPVNRYRDELIAGAGNEDIFFGCISVQFDSAIDLSETTQFIYSGIFDFLQRSIYPNLLRVWNYFPDINAIEAGIERYCSFSVGRHEAFVRYNRRVDDSPSACAVGSHGGPLVIYFLASRFPGVQIENPRQTSAYNYPKQYGPRSPTFSRATLAFQGGSQTLFISGTASILGHATVHPSSASLQTRETLANIRAVIDQAIREGFKFAGFESGMALKVYVRHTEHLSVVQDIIREEWGVIQELVVLQTDICRTDLLLEIEAVCWG
ncbi:MAG: hypothetical protein HY935_01615 [Nitrosomonadales bacterium]|nr:hypothetical protein [Nitrosomonadales bacterium]